VGGSPATDLSAALLVRLVSLGVRHVVVSPGSRSQALALVAAELERRGSVHLTVRIDERVAGFTALGLAVESGQPTVVIVTSGTAVANLHPAVLEARHSGVPLILLTADRPPELRGIGSNQTTEQVGLFGPAVPWTRDVEPPAEETADASANGDPEADGDASVPAAGDASPPGGVSASAPHGAPPSAPGDVRDAVQRLAEELAREAYATATGSRGAAGPVQLNLALREPLSGSVDLDAVSSAVEGGPPSALPFPAGMQDPIHSHRRHTVPGSAETAASLEAPNGEAPSAVDPGPHESEELRAGHGQAVAVPRPPGAGAAAGHPIDDATGAVVVAGHGAGPIAEELARRMGAPLIAEVSSGARFGPNLVVAYRELLRDERFAARIRMVVVFGHPTLSREVPALLQRPDVRVVSVRGPGFEPYDPGRRALVVDSARFDGEPAERAWAGEWVTTSRRVVEEYEGPDGSAPAPPAPARLVAADAADGGRAAQAEFSREQLAAFREPVSRRSLVEAVWRATWPHDRLVLGASRLIRELDGVAPGRRVRVHANRGLAGIDGTVSTATGIALAAEAAGSPGVTRVLLGDLALLHDAGALLAGAGERRPRLQVIVGDDGGGSIFDGLEVAASAPRDAFERVMTTPQRVSFAQLAAAYGWEHVHAGNRGELDQALTASDGVRLVEVPLPR